MAGVLSGVVNGLLGQAGGSSYHDQAQLQLHKELLAMPRKRMLLIKNLLFLANIPNAQNTTTSQAGGEGQAQNTAPAPNVNPFAALFGGNVRTPMPGGAATGANAQAATQQQGNFMQQLGAMFSQQVRI